MVPNFLRLNDWLTIVKSSRLNAAVPRGTEWADPRALTLMR